MRMPLVLIAFLALMSPAVPAAATEAPVPATHEEFAQSLDHLLGQLHELGARWREHFRPSESRAERPLISLMLRHRDELGLTPEQIQRLEQLRTDFQREAVRRDAEIRVAELDLAALLDAEQPDLATVEPKVREVERLRADLRIARIRTIEEGRAQLTAEQRQKLRAMLVAPPPRPHGRRL